MSTVALDTSLVGTQKPERSTGAACFQFLCIFGGPVGWGIAILMWWNLREEIKEWGRQQLIGATMVQNGQELPVSPVAPVATAPVENDGWS